MDSGFGTQDILTGRGLGLYGFGYGNDYLQCGNSGLAADAHANGTATNARIECNGAAQAAQLDRLSAQNEETRRILQNDATRGDIADIRLQSAITDGQINVALCEAFAKLGADNAKCCCDTQKLILEHDAKEAERFAAQTAIIEANDKAAILRDLSNRDRELQTQTIINSCGCNPCHSATI